MPSESRKRKSKDDSEEPVLKKRTKANDENSTPAEKPEKQEDEKGDPYWELSNKRRMIVQEFKGKTLVALREFYEKDGKLLPGKSGINLTIEQLSAIVLALPELTAALEEKGHSIPRVSYDGGGEAVEKETKRNFDATSDEDE